MQDFPAMMSFSKDVFSMISTDSMGFFPERPKTALRKPSNCGSSPFSPQQIIARRSRVFD
jgi:hypothetical protein